ncbi:MAG TPA: flavodoxin domain-containing protein, partial [Longimicrobiales bacterium]|nr:flavodoxin domain-containing protein [Longimicrobiales bacterium]
MARILVVYGTMEGQTRKVAQFAADLIRDAGCDVELLAVEAVTSVQLLDVDAVLLAASIHVGRHKPAVHAFVRAHRALLASTPSAFLSVSLSAANEQHHADALGYLNAFLDETGWQPALRDVVGGALRYSEYGVLKRLMMKHIARSHGLSGDTSRDHELTDWDR